MALAGVAQVVQPQARQALAPITIESPLPESVFPPEFPSPTFLFRDANPRAVAWVADIAFANGAPGLRLAIPGARMKPGPIDPRAVSPNNAPPTLNPQQAASRTWKPDPDTWAAIQRNGAATIRFSGYAAKSTAAPLSRGELRIYISPDPVGAPIFYRDVPLMPSETEKGVIKPLATAAVPLISWRLRDVAKTESRVVTNFDRPPHSCGRGGTGK